MWPGGRNIPRSVLELQCYTECKDSKIMFKVERDHGRRIQLNIFR